MTLAYLRRKFEECPACKAKPGTPTLCRECLERRELYAAIEKFHTLPLRYITAHWVTIFKNCPTCDGTPNPACREHGR